MPRLRRRLLCAVPRAGRAILPHRDLLRRRRLGGGARRHLLAHLAVSYTHLASTAAGIDVAYGISAAVAAIALIVAVLKVHNAKKRAVATPAPQAEAPRAVDLEEAREGAGR